MNVYIYGRKGGYIGPIARIFEGVRRHGKVYVPENSTNEISFVHVDDLAEMFALVLRLPNVKGQYFAITDTVAMTKAAIAVSAITGNGRKVEYVDFGTAYELNGMGALDFQINMRASARKAIHNLGWRPQQAGVVDDLKALAAPVDPRTVYPSRSRAEAATEAIQMDAMEIGLSPRAAGHIGKLRHIPRHLAAPVWFLALAANGIPPVARHLLDIRRHGRFEQAMP